MRVSKVKFHILEKTKEKEKEKEEIEKETVTVEEAVERGMTEEPTQREKENIEVLI